MIKGGSMTEKEKMIAGQLYNPMDAILAQDRQKAHDICYELRMTAPHDRQRIIRLTSDLFAYNTDEIYITPPFFCDYGYNISLGRNFYCNTDCVLLDCAPIVIGDNVLLGPKVQIYTALHPLKAEDRSTLEYARPISIAANVWIGGGAIICAGVSIGEGSVVGAGSVVTRDIPARTLAVGNPARPIRDL